MNFNVFEVLGVTGILDGLDLRVAVQQMQVVQFELVTHLFYFALEDEVITFKQVVQDLFVIFVAVLWDRKYDISEIFRLTGIHFDENTHEKLVSEHAEWFIFFLCVYVIAVPLNNIILIYLTEFMESVYLVFHDFLSRAFLKVVAPSSCNVPTLDIRPIKETMVNSIRFSSYIVKWEAEKSN